MKGNKTKKKKPYVDKIRKSDSKISVKDKRLTECFDKIFQNIERTYEIKEGNLKSYRLFSETPSIFHQEEVKQVEAYFFFFFLLKILGSRTS